MRGIKIRGGGGHLYPRKRTFKIHPKHVFSGMKIDPIYAFFACVVLNLSIVSFPKFVNMTKNTPFFLILHVFAPLNYVRAYIFAWS